MAPPHETDEQRQHGQTMMSVKSSDDPLTVKVEHPGDSTTAIDSRIDENKNETNDKKILLRTTSIGTRKCRILVDLVLVCTGFCLHIAAYSGTMSLQSSINGQLGIESLTAASISGMVSNLLLPALVIGKFGLKWSIVGCVILRAVFPAANFHTAWWTLIPGGALSGLMVGPMWAAQSAYITWLGRRYAETNDESADSINSKFIGVFFMFVRFANLVGNFLSSLVFQRPAASAVGVAPLPQSDEIVRKVCASNYCYEDLNEIFNRASNFTIEGGPSFYRPSDYQKNLLFGIYVALLMMSPLLLLFISSKDEVKSTDASKSGRKLYKKLSATFRHMTHWKAVLLMPLSLYSGVSFSFFITSFNLAFVTCALGIDSLGYVSTAAAAAGAASAIVCGSLVKYTGGRAIILLAAAGKLATLVVMLNWNLSSESNVSLYVIAATWGASGTVIQSQFTAFMGSLFGTDKSESSAYASHHLWIMAGMTIWQSASVYMCVGFQIYVVMASLAVGIIGLLVVDVLSERSKKDRPTAAAAAAAAQDLQTDTRL